MDELLQRERHSDRGDQERQRSRVAPPERAVGHRLQSDCSQTGYGHREQHGDTEIEHRQTDAPVVGVSAGCEAQDHVETEIRTEHAEHEDLGVGEVDQPQHTEHQGVADRYQCVNRAPGEPVDGQLPEAFTQVIDVETDIACEVDGLAEDVVDHLGADSLRVNR